MVRLHLIGQGFHLLNTTPFAGRTDLEPMNRRLSFHEALAEMEGVLKEAPRNARATEHSGSIYLRGRQTSVHITSTLLSPQP